jgi:tetratricopeptide (TPR) repeat protein
VTKLSIAHAIVPFWKRLPQFFAYPLVSFHSLILLAVISAATVLFIGVDIFKVLMRFVLFGIVLKYAYSALVSTSNGNLKAPRISLETVSDNFGIVFKQIAIYFLMGIIGIILVRFLGVGAGFFFLFFAMLLLPSMIIILAVTNSFFAAVNPGVFLRLAFRIGWPYLALYFFLTILGSAPTLIGRFVGPHVPLQLLVFIMSFVSGYYMIVSYHLMGYVLFQYHEEAGYEIDYEDEEPVNATADTAENELLTKINIYVKEGDIDGAISFIQGETHGHIDDMALAERYYTLLQLKQKTHEMVNFGKDYLKMLAKKNQKERLSEVYLECKNLDTGFDPEPSTMYAVAKALNETGNHEKALQVFKSFIKEDSHDPMVPNALFFIAKILNEKLNEPITARGILRHVIQKYPFHENTTFVQAYVNQMQG